MTLIVGVGDEVVQFSAVVLLIIVAALAWWTTNTRPDGYRTILVMRPRTHHPVTVSIRPRSSSQVNNTMEAPVSSSEGVQESNIIDDHSERSDVAQVIPLQEMDSIIDADMALMDDNRLHFYRRVDSLGNSLATSESIIEEIESQSEEEQESASNAQIREMDSIVSAMEADTEPCSFCTKPEDDNSKTANRDHEPESDSSNTANNDAENQTHSDSTDSPIEQKTKINDAKKILIKLKFLNESLREVEGSLDELLKDFKWRHFATELSDSRRVRLIFNGRPLTDEAATLAACGLHHRAVVHCLVQSERDHRQQPRVIPDENTMNATHELVTEGDPPERAWDLENILMTLVSVALTVVWFFRCEYSNMFTASASVALFGLTVFYSVAIFGLYLSDTFHFERRPAQPVPDN